MTCVDCDQPIGPDQNHVVDPPRHIHCAFKAGDLFEKPAPVNAMTAWLHSMNARGCASTGGNGDCVQHDWAGAWMNSLFRNESPHLHLSSDLIRQAVAVTRTRWPDAPTLGIVTFVDASKTRRKRDPGRCYRRAGFKHVGFTKAGLYVFQMLEPDMPEPAEPLGWQAALPLAASLVAS